MSCPECGKEISAGERSCPNCGAKVEGGGSSALLSIRSSGNQNLSLVGGALLLVSFFMPWIDLGFISVSGFGLLKVSSGSEKLLAIIAWLVPIGGGITAYFVYTKNVNVRKVSLITVVIALFVWLWMFFSLGVDIKKMTGSFGNIFQALGIGLYLMLAGVVCLAISVKSALTGIFTSSSN